MTAVSFAAADSMTYSALEDDFKGFSDDMAKALPFASTVGMNWSNAYLGNFPHFGVGLTTGFVTLPADNFESVASQLGVSLPSEFFGLGIGVPLPAYTVDGRLALPVLPLDLGVKVGFLDPSWSEGLTGGAAGVDYLLLGGDVRWGLVKDKGILPAVSIGTGYNYMKGGLLMKNIVGATTLTSVAGHTVSMSSADMVYEWSANVIDVKAQISKNLFILTPSVGLGYSYGFSQAGGGMDANILVDGHTPTPSEISTIESATGMTLDDQSLRILSEVKGGTLRAWAGCSVNLFVLKLDLNAMYNVFSGNLGATLNARIQI